MPTVLDYLSGIKSCFLQAGLTFEWPPLAYRLVRGEGSLRRRAGLEHATTKLPFMPRVAEALDHALQFGELSPKEATAIGAILLCFYFGWRSSTVAVLHSRDISVCSVSCTFQFSERFSKGAF